MLTFHNHFKEKLSIDLEIRHVEDVLDGSPRETLIRIEQCLGCYTISNKEDHKNGKKHKHFYHLKEKRGQCLTSVKGLFFQQV